jgi:hypothetical protein
MEAKRGLAKSERLTCAKFSVRKVKWIAADGQAEMPEVHADLIGATSQWSCFQ